MPSIRQGLRNLGTTVSKDARKLWRNRKQIVRGVARELKQSAKTERQSQKKSKGVVHDVLDSVGAAGIGFYEYGIKPTVELPMKAGNYVSNAYNKTKEKAPSLPSFKNTREGQRLAKERPISAGVGGFAFGVIPVTKVAKGAVGKFVKKGPQTGSYVAGAEGSVSKASAKAAQAAARYTKKPIPKGIKGKVPVPAKKVLQGLPEPKAKQFPPARKSVSAKIVSDGNYRQPDIPEFEVLPEFNTLPKKPMGPMERVFRYNHGGKAPDEVVPDGVDEFIHSRYHQGYRPSEGKYARAAKAPPRTQKPPQPPIDHTIPDGRVVVPNSPSRFSQQTVRHSKNTVPELPKHLDAEYTPITNEATLARARANVDLDPTEVYKRTFSESPNAEDLMGGLELARRIQSTDPEKAADIINRVSIKASKQGQDIQALSVWDRFTPEGALRDAGTYAQRARKKVNPVAAEVYDDAESIVRDLTRARKTAIENVMTPSGGARGTSDPFAIFDELATRAAAKMRPNKPPKTTGPDPFEDLINEVVSKQREMAPKYAGKRPTTDPYTLMGRALEFKDDIYKPVWDRAKVKVYNKYKNNPQALDDLDAFFNDDFLRPYSQKTLDKIFRTTRDAYPEDFDFKKLVYDHYSDVNASRAQLERELMNKTGLDYPTIKPAVDDLEARFNQSLDKARRKALDDLLKPKIKNPAERRSLGENLIRLNNAGFLTSTQAVRDAIAAKYGLPHLGQDKAARIASLADEIQVAEKQVGKQSDAYAELVGQLNKEIAEIHPPGFLDRVKAIYQGGMLANPVTAERNIIGETKLMGNELAAQGLASLTGQVPRPRLGAALGGFKRGIRAGWRDIQQGIDTSGLSDELLKKYDYRPGFAFPENANVGPLRRFGYKIGRGVEKTARATTQLYDRGVGEAQFDNWMAGLLAQGVDPQTAQNIAKNMADYVTLRRETGLATGLTDLRNKANFGKPFGLGTIVAPFTYTPANLAATAFDYSPFGGLATVIRNRGINMDPTDVAMGLSRAAIGTGEGLGGYALRASGNMTGDEDSSYGVNINRELLGLQPNSFIIGDQTINPTSLLTPSNITAGAKLYDQLNPEHSEPQDPLSAGLDLMANTVGSIVDLPMLQGAQRLYQGATSGSPSKAALDVAGSLGAGFVPQVVSKVASITDNNRQRQTTGGNPLENIKNRIFARIPGLRQTLPQAYNVRGEADTQYPEGSNALRILFDPTMRSTIEDDPVVRESLELMHTTGKKDHLLRQAGATMQIEGKRVRLSARQRAYAQKYMGERAYGLTKWVMKQPEYQQLSDSDKVSIRRSIIKASNAALKMDMFEVTPGDLTQLGISIYEEDPDYAKELLYEAMERRLNQAAEEE